MALIDKLTAIADAIREQTGKENLLTHDQMPLEIAEIQTGVELGFEVVGGTVAPASPKENTIWINTDAEITGYIFSATDPLVSKIITLSTISGNQWYLSSPEELSDGKVLNFEIPATVNNSYEAINITDSTTGIEYYIRNNDGSACSSWTEGTKVCVVLSSDVNGINGYGNTAKTAYIHSYGSYDLLDDISEGMVWISTGTSSPTAFNALEKNGITVYPISAKQYVSGAWVDKTAKTYQNSEWVDWITYYYKNGTTYDDMTGGYTYNSNTTMEADNIKMYTDGDGSYAYATTNNKIDISGISTLSMKFNLKAVSSYDRTVNVYLYVSDNKLTDPTQSVGTGATASKAYSEGTDMEDIIELDVSSVTGSKYIFICAKNTGKYYQETTNIKEIRGE